MMLVTGSSGFIGGEIARKLGCIGTYMSTKPDHEALKLDITKRAETLDVISSARPDVVVHSAAAADVDYCELHPEEAWRINVDGTRNIRDACKAAGAKVIFISTDYVFDGERGMYRETDQTRAICQYSKTKIEAEKIIMQSSDYIVLRPSVVYGSASRKFASFIIKSLSEGKTVNAFDDLFACPTFVNDIVNSIETLKSLNGIYHVAGAERISRYGFALNIAKVFGLDKGLIKPSPANRKVFVAPRPKDSSLDTSKIRKEGIRTSGTVEGLKEMKREMES